MKYDINIPRLLEEPTIIKIGDTSYVKVCFYEKRNTKYYDVILNIDNKETFLGRFVKEFYKIKIKQKDGRILIYNDRINASKKSYEIIKVLGLYDILDDVFYSCTEEEALNLFDNKLETNFLENKNNLIVRSDVEKRKRFNESEEPVEKIEPVTSLEKQKIKIIKYDK